MSFSLLYFPPCHPPLFLFTSSFLFSCFSLFSLPIHSSSLHLFLPFLFLGCVLPISHHISFFSLCTSFVFSPLSPPTFISLLCLYLSPRLCSHISFIPQLSISLEFMSSFCLSFFLLLSITYFISFISFQYLFFHSFCLSLFVPSVCTTSVSFLTVFLAFSLLYLSLSQVLSSQLVLPLPFLSFNMG